MAVVSPRSLLAVPLLLALLWGCAGTGTSPTDPAGGDGGDVQEVDGATSPPDGAPDGPPMVDSAGDGTVNDASGVVWITPPATCEPPLVLPADPLVHLDTKKAKTMIIHIIDVEPDPAGDRVYAAGYPGLMIFSNEGGVLDHVGVYPNGAWKDANAGPGEVIEFDHMEPLGDHKIALTARGVTPTVWWFKHAIETHGLFIVDTSDPAVPALVSELDLTDLSDMAKKDDLLHVVTYMGDLHTIDIADRADPQLVHTTSGLGHAWKIIHVGDLAYVADAQIGLVTVDMSVPTAPVVLGANPAAIGAQDVWYDDGFIYLAIGVPGVAIFDTVDPTAPALVSTLSTGPSVVGVSVDEGVAWAANQEGIVAIDVSDPHNPLQIATKDTPDWAMNAYAFGHKVYVADWDYIHTYEIHPLLLAPEMDPSPEDLYFWEGSGARTMTITNRGGAPLEIAGLEVSDPRFHVAVDRLTLPPTEKLTVKLDFADDGAPVDATLCVATNDPDQPVQQIRLHDTSEFDSGSKVGQPAPDFILPDIHGEAWYQLSDYFGLPIYLCFFSTW